jgi:hypothetical protein
MIYEWKAVGGMRIIKRNRCTRRKPCSVPLCPPQLATWFLLGSNTGQHSPEPPQVWHGFDICTYSTRKQGYFQLHRDVRSFTFWGWHYWVVWNVCSIKFMWKQNGSLVQSTSLISDPNNRQCLSPIPHFNLDSTSRARNVHVPDYTETTSVTKASLLSLWNS